MAFTPKWGFEAPSPGCEHCFSLSGVKPAESPPDSSLGQISGNSLSDGSKNKYLPECSPQPGVRADHRCLVTRKCPTQVETRGKGMQCSDGHILSQEKAYTEVLQAGAEATVPVSLLHNNSLLRGI